MRDHDVTLIAFVIVCWAAIHRFGWLDGGGLACALLLLGARK